MGVAEQARRRISPELGDLFGIGVASLTTGEETASAEEALTAGNREGHDDAIANLQLAVLPTNLNDLTHRFVAHDVTAMQVGHHAIEVMKV